MPMLPEGQSEGSFELPPESLQSSHPAVLGGAFYHRDGHLLGSFGDRPEWGSFDFSHNNTNLYEHPDERSIETHWSASQLGRSYDLVLRIDLSDMSRQLILYIVRISGLILTISLVLTATLVLTIGRSVYFPLVRLANALDQASHHPERADLSAFENGRDDEIGQLAASCRRLLEQTGKGLIELRSHREALADTNSKLEQAVAERTAALASANRSLKAEIAERVDAEAQLTHQAMHDALTSLPNRVLFRDRLAQSLFMARRNEEQIAVLCLDLDRFKEVNDTLGHQVGDELLKQVGLRIDANIRETDTLARLGGDEFAIIQTGLAQPEGSQNLANRLMQLIDSPFCLDGHDVVVGLSVGISIGPSDAEQPDTLLSNADIALRRAKSEGRRAFRFFEPSMDAQRRSRLAIERDLRCALAEKQLELHYQPQICSNGSRLCGFEALIRWQHPERGMIPPGDFIQVAEETGLILPIGDWVLSEACQDALSWPEDIRVSVNLSPAQFQHRDLAALVRETLQKTGLNPNRLELEITEGMLLKNTDSTLSTLHHIRDLGVQIAMDDFGTGYSSLSYLRSFPFDTIKIDQSFVFGLGENADADA
ncbi:MAG: EAL domain-containing protein, partial [Pseudomonadota bacterium]